jgi:putative membrane protein
VLIKRGRQQGHIRAMATAVAVSAAFLVSYVTHKIMVGPRLFGHEGEAIRTVYFVILVSHTILAVVVVPLVIVTVLRAVRGRLEAHKKIAKWTVPVWLYVSVTGVVVYLMLYQMK